MPTDLTWRPLFAGGRQWELHIGGLGSRGPSCEACWSRSGGRGRWLRRPGWCGSPTAALPLTTWLPASSTRLPPRRRWHQTTSNARPSPPKDTTRTTRRWSPPWLASVRCWPTLGQAIRSTPLRRHHSVDRVFATTPSVGALQREPGTSGLSGMWSCLSSTSKRPYGRGVVGAVVVVGC
jgi:hypothetical protein